MRITILGEYSRSTETHAFTNNALSHSAAQLGEVAEFVWISTADISETDIYASDGLWLTTGGPYKNPTKALSAIGVARENKVPTLGTCGGFQHMVLEFARNALGIADAQHAEYEPAASNLIISPLACSLKGREMRLSFMSGSHPAKLYGSLSAEERYYCSFGINPSYVPILQAGLFRPVGFDEEGAIRVMEISSHPFYLGTLFVPQARSTASQPHPLVSGFLRAAVQRHLNRPRATAI